MKILITGGAGFIGSAVVRRLLLESGHAVVNLDALTYAGHSESLRLVEDHPDYAFAEADIRERASLDAVFAEHRPDAVMHLAAESHVDRSIDSPMDFVTTNVVGTVNLLESATRYFETLTEEARAAFRFLHVSTDEVYGALGATGRFTEETPYEPNSPYSASKAASDHFARAWHKTYGLPVIISHASNNYGPYQLPEKLIPVILLAGLEGRPIPIYGDGQNVRDWLFVDDHAEALEAILLKGRPGETYNVGGDAEIANLDMAKRICALLDSLRPSASHRPHESLIQFVADRPGHDWRYAIDTSKLRDELGWRPKRDLDDGLAATVRWYLDNEWWWQGLRQKGLKHERQGMASAGAKERA